jgi:VCBS repeat-containing protein
MIVLAPVIHKAVRKSQYCKALIHGMQPTSSTAALDSSGNANSAAINPNAGLVAATYAQIWANAGWITTVSSGNKDGGLSTGGTGAASVLPWNGYAQDSMGVFGTVAINSATFDQGLFGNSTISPGIRVYAAANTGYLQVTLQDNSGNTYSANTTVVVADGNLHQIGIFVNGNSAPVAGFDTGARTVRIVIDGNEVACANGGVFAVPNSTLPSYSFGIGHTGNPAVSGTSGGRFRDLQLYWMPAGVFFKNVVAAARYYSLRPYDILPASLVEG